MLLLDEQKLLVKEEEADLLRVPKWTSLALN
jgi:hypothetical protein